MKIVYMGTPDFAVPALNELIKHHEVLAVFTQPDRPVGRGYKLTPSPVKTVALNHGIEVLQPTTLKLKKMNPCEETKKIRNHLKNMNADIFVVAAYGQILPKAVLEMPSLACINIHASLLPKYRGASPIHAALLNGDTETGITIMHMDIGIDTGDMILKKSLSIEPEERLPSLHDRLADLGAKCVIEAINQLENGTATRTPQNHNESSHAPMISKTDGHINWNQPTQQIINRLRALDPWPGSYSIYDNNPLKIWAMEACLIPSNATPGTIISADATDGLRVKTLDGVVNITEVQPGGKKRMTTDNYLRGHKIMVGLELK